MRYRNYKSYSTYNKVLLPNIISETIVDYFTHLNITHPYNINTLIYDKHCKVYIPKTNILELKNYLYSQNNDLISNFKNLEFIETSEPFFSDYLSYGNYYGYAISNNYGSIPKGKSISNTILNKLDEKHSSILQVTYDTKNDNLTRLTLFTTDKTVDSNFVFTLSEYITEDTNIKVVYTNHNTNGEFYTNNSNLHITHEIPSHNPLFVGADPLSPSKVIPLYLRHIAKSMVNSSLLDECLITANYTNNSLIPVTLNIDSFGTEKYPMKYIYTCLMDVFPLSLKDIKKEIDFFKPIYRQSSECDYVNNINLPWESTNKSKDLIIF
jgi:S-adenosylmethionine synthetase